MAILLRTPWKQCRGLPQTRRYTPPQPIDILVSIGLLRWSWCEGVVGIDTPLVNCSVKLSANGTFIHFMGTSIHCIVCLFVYRNIHLHNRNRASSPKVCIFCKIFPNQSHIQWNACNGIYWKKSALLTK